MKRTIYKKELACGIIFLFLITSIAPVMSGSTNENNQYAKITPASLPATEKTTTFTFYVFGKTTIEKYDVEISTADASTISAMFEELKQEMTTSPSCEKTQRLQQEFCTILKEKGVIPQEMSQKELVSLLQPPVIPEMHRQWNIAPFQNKASEWLCTYVSFGSGAAFPIIILPRFIPFILTPIPRVFLRWSAKDGVTSCGGLASGTGFIAVGEQKGFALGFWGIGFTFSIPPLMNTYGMAGYALYATVTADYIEHYPPNRPPEITGADPMDGEENVPVSLSELRFRIDDEDGDLMNYEVTTEPDIGSGSASLKQDGVYSIPVEGLDSLTQYTWYLSVTDGKDTTMETYTFITEPTAPLITNPSPENGERDVPMDITHLRFTIKDFQGDLMEYTVETSPSIGSAHETNVHDGTYIVPISGLIYSAIYHWYVNVTDGEHWARKAYSFQTGYPALFNPFDYGWQYKKQITVDHTLVADDLISFPVLVSIVDPDLMKAQADGDDILFMSAADNASKWRHEIESFDRSTGTLAVWVNIPVLSSDHDTIFYLYYGNPSCINQEYPEKTWDAHYLGVWHMNDETPSTVSDSTRYSHPGTKKAANTPVESEGMTGYAQRFTCTEDRWEYITMGNSNTFYLSGDFTISAWINPQTTQSMRVVGKHQEISANYKGYSLNYNLQGPDTRMSLRIDNGGYNYEYTYADSAKPPNTWYFMTGAKRLGTNYLYIDGIQQTDTGSQVVLNSDYPFCVGAWKTESQSCNFYGTIDEVRLSDIGRSSAWVQTEFNTISDPAHFIVVGPEEPGP